MSDMACNEEYRNEKRDNTEGPAEDFHESVKGYVGMRQVDSKIYNM